jgi:hypothetical protein
VAAIRPISNRRNEKEMKKVITHGEFILKKIHKEVKKEMEEEDFNEKESWDVANNPENYSKTFCMMCESIFEENLKFTDGLGYFCEKCSLTMEGIVYPTD